MPHKPGHIKTGQGGKPLGSTTRRGGKSVGGGNKTTSTTTTSTTNGNNTKNDNRNSELLAAASDAAGDRADQHKGKTHTPEADPIRKSGASHNARFLEVWHSGYKLDEPNM